MTHLVAADVPLDDHAMLQNAVLHWRANLDVRKLVCIGCKASFLRDDIWVGVFLLSVPISVPDNVAISAFCTECPERLSIAPSPRVSCGRLRRASAGPGC